MVAEWDIDAKVGAVTDYQSVYRRVSAVRARVCCRLIEYRWLPERLKLNGAICLEPLSSEEVSKYLDAGGSKLAALREAIDADPMLHELAQTPLMLSIMSLAYQGAGRVELAAQSGASLNERRKQSSTSTLSRCFNERG